MRLLVLTADYPPRPWSGIGVAVAAQARALAAAGVEVTVLVAGGGEAAGGAGESRPNLRVLPLGRCSFPLDPRRFDAVHVHSLRLGELAVELARRYALPLAATAHGLVHRELGATATGHPWSMAQRRLLGAADRAVLVSAAERAAAVAWLPEIAARSRVVPNAVEPAVFPAGAPRRPPDAAAPVVFAGRFAASKGMDLLAGLVPRLLAAGRRVVLAGGHGDAAGEALARRLAAAFPGRCRLAGWLGRGELSSLLGGAALAVVPSRYEPFGLVAAEALAAGAPVLAADVGGLREVVGEGSGGRRLASRDPRRWAAAAAEMLAASGAGGAGAAAGPAWVARRFAPAARRRPPGARGLRLERAGRRAGGRGRRRGRPWLTRRRGTSSSSPTR